MEINQLLRMEDVTDRVQGATRGLSGEAFFRAQKAEFTRIEKACQTSEQLKCDVVTLYHGGQYQLYTYRRWKKDVRLVFAPEESIAFFGGDPDNFNFPRYDLDVTFLRVYEDGKPRPEPDHFRWATAGPTRRRADLRLRQPRRHRAGSSPWRSWPSLRDEVIPLKLERLAAAPGLGGAVPGAQPRGPPHQPDRAVRRGERATRPGSAGARR